MTDEERCEVAARLRELAEDYEKVPVLSIIAACELPAPVDDAFMACGIGRAVYATEICGRLADLIEPEERTCRNTAGKPFAGYRMFSCSECGAYLEVDGDTDANLFAGGERPMPRYCPNCGAKVVEE